MAVTPHATRKEGRKYELTHGSGLQASRFHQLKGSAAIWVPWRGVGASCTCASQSGVAPALALVKEPKVPEVTPVEYLLVAAPEVEAATWHSSRKCPPDPVGCTESVETVALRALKVPQLACPLPHVMLREAVTLRAGGEGGGGEGGGGEGGGESGGGELL